MDTNGHQRPASIIRNCRADEIADLLRIINAAAQAYRGVIPADCWHEPYMSAAELTSEIAAGVIFSCCQADEGVLGVMGVQQKHNVDLIRHAYVLPSFQGSGVGSKFLAKLCGLNARPVLVGTWRAAAWAIRFYERHGFSRVPDDAVALLLRRYWTVPDRQIDMSVVLSSPTLDGDGVRHLIAVPQEG